ncbi:MAG: hypothetical protein GWM90_19915, partial [Gemmatimonadetes bacterium]|nr:SWF/SNF helicase family protein [Gemmatimonadota bacterium]NIQ56707.1 SWF/SNF helicase family protein [Gemmatimonadota bacterium]NIU76893.1 hypothetical protein [Gammaproteobacteria bacterium]NIX46268.1 hypothetical protein [Gemmatimonadota bacterium]NIY10590.1 hypothetical protein [Gemmatimonadota bacterium]
LERLRGLCQEFVRAAESGRVIAPRAATRRAADGDPLQLVLTDLVADPAAPGVDLRAAAASADRDLRRVEALLRSLDRDDPKLAALERLLDAVAPEPVIVFTEFRDTAAYLQRSLLDRRVARIDGAGAWLGRHPAGRRNVVERFAPRANGRPPPPAREAVRVLVATDVVAEGLNLQDARLVISYDLPWNPVRLLQRIGRVDRLGSRHLEVVPYLFAPDRGLDAVLGLTRRLRAKLHGIVGALGDEGGDLLLTALTREPSALQDAMHAVERARTLDPRETLRTLWIRERGRGPVVGSPASPASPTSRDPGRPRTRPVRQEPCSARHSIPTHPEPRVAHLPVPPRHPAAGIAALALLARGPGTCLVEITARGDVREPGEGAVAALETALGSGADLDPSAVPASGPSRGGGE